MTSLSLSFRAANAMRVLVAQEVRSYMRAAKFVPETWNRAEALARAGHRIRSRVLHRHQHKLVSDRVLQSLERRGNIQDRGWWPKTTDRYSTENAGAIMLARQTVQSRGMGQSTTQRLIRMRQRRPTIVIKGE